MAVWMVRAGKHGEHESLALEKGVSVVGWTEFADLSDIGSREELDALYREAHPEASTNVVSNKVGQLWAFKERIKKGDLVVLPLKARSAIAIGRITGPYKYRTELPEGARHTRCTKWLKTDIPRNSVDQDLLYSLGAYMTVCQIQRNDAEQRITAMLEETPSGRGQKIDGGGTTLPPEEQFDLEQYAIDQIRQYIGRKFLGHDLARLVNELLRAQGYRTQMSAPGADGGVDVLAGAGPLGFDHPRLCVQVKSSSSPLDVSALRELQGILKNFGAEQGLLVSWGGFKSSVMTEARRLFFEIRLWDAGDLVTVLLQNYAKLSPDIQAELPLKTVWALVLEEME